eukprot:Phypoly_transcript_21346.p1 GENE.Phypoly_transcript_21346~~Phypoly_transcript_21346.p1  ORF type:complete len:123 (+),score=17.73 Phypoly_transcript_21346:117-485(+)
MQRRRRRSYQSLVAPQKLDVDIFSSDIKSFQKTIRSVHQMISKIAPPRKTSLTKMKDISQCMYTCLLFPFIFSLSPPLFPLSPVPFPLPFFLFLFPPFPFSLFPLFSFPFSYLFLFFFFQQS